jgi:hypothetical protein
MPAPFYDAVKGTTSGTPGVGAFTPNAAPAGYRSWATVPTNWMGLVRFEDASNAWELCFCYWNGTTLSRASTQVFDSSTGSQLTLTSAATASMVIDAAEIMPDLAATSWRGWFPVVNGATPSAIGLPAATITGTGAGVLPAATNWLTEQPRTQITSLTTANAQAGQSTATVSSLVSTTAGRGGFTFRARFGCSVLPTGPRLFVGMTNATFVGVTTEPSASRTAANACFAKDSGDTNIQLLVNDNSASASTKTDTGIPLTANAWYEAVIWVEPGSTRVNALLMRLDTGAIWFGTTTTDVPPNGALMFPQIIAGLSATTGTAVVLHVGGVTVRSGQ